MPVRIKDWMIPYTWWQWIEITNNHVINVLLREMNNLIHVNGDRELYVDLQLDDWIAPDDDFPVGVTTGKILQEDWWQQSWIILNWKTTSWDYVRFIYANDGKLYYDPWTWQWIEIWTGWGWVQINVATASTLWLIKLGSDAQQLQAPVTATSISGRTYPVQLNADNQAVVNIPWENTTYTAGNNITINQNNEISATIPSALVYKWTVNDLSDLPASWTVWDTYFVEWEDGMYSWDWTQWAYVWWTWIDTSNFFDKTIDTSDDIVQGTTNLFVTQNEKNTWNGKQDRLTVWDGIDITNNVISNTLPFNPWNAGSLGQFLKKTNDGYAWANVPSWWWNFNPQNTGTVWQVLTKTDTGYDWETIAGWEGNVKLFTMSNTTDTATVQSAIDWLNAGKLPILKCNATFWYYEITWDYYFYPVQDSTSTSTNLIFQAVPTSNNSYILPNGKVRRYRPIIRVELDTHGDVNNVTVTTSEADREDITRTWVGTQAEYNLLTPETWVIYNIIPS